MTSCLIRLSGCDDSTAFVVDLDDTELALVQRIAERSQETSQYSCQPRMTITSPAPDPDEDVPF